MTARMEPDPERPNRFYLYVGDSEQSHVDLDDPLHLEFDYIRYLSYVVDSLAPSGEPLRVLHLGAGALTLPRYVAAKRPGSYQQAVDIDAELVALVREKAPLPKRGKVKVRIGDAREQLAAAPDDCYDVIVLDVFADNVTPPHLTTAEFFADVSRVLRTGGSLLMNAGDGGPLKYTRSLAATIGSVFGQGRLLGGTTVLRGRRFGNIVLCGSDRPFDDAAIARRAAGDVFPTGFLDGDEFARFGKGAPVNTDGGAVASPAPPGLWPQTGRGVRKRSSRGAARP
ncbi:fused MFS/spermidine synthase [Phytomonospora sp. NPDC050363]|uniref:spermidine synthase n=1 Tax=Phytomonospora sp. NPDC050363 TaxID=3155642 RepID=UPI0033FF116C